MTANDLIRAQQAMDTFDEPIELWPADVSPCETAPVTEHITLISTLPADGERKTWFTDNGVAITPGLRVFTNDWVWGIVQAKQFEKDDDRPAPVDKEWFDGWFRVDIEPDQKWASGEGLYNGERMTTVKPS